MGSRSPFSTRITIVWDRPDRVATSLRESPCLRRSERRSSMSFAMTASRCEGEGTTYLYRVDRLTGDGTIGTICAVDSPLPAVQGGLNAAYV